MLQPILLTSNFATLFYRKFCPLFAAEIGQYLNGALGSALGLQAHLEQRPVRDREEGARSESGMYTYGNLRFGVTIIDLIKERYVTN